MTANLPSSPPGRTLPPGWVIGPRLFALSAEPHRDCAETVLQDLEADATLAGKWCVVEVEGWDTVWVKVLAFAPKVLGHPLVQAILGRRVGPPR